MLAFADDGEPVADGQYHLLHPVVTGYVVVECLYAAGLAVVVVGRVYHVAVPQRVVGDDVTAVADDGQQGVVGLPVGALVAVYEGHVKLYAQAGSLYIGIAYAELDAVGHGRALYPRPGKVLHLIVYLVGPHGATFFQTLCHADGAVAAERAHFEYVFAC